MVPFKQVKIYKKRIGLQHTIIFISTPKCYISDADSENVNLAPVLVDCSDREVSARHSSVIIVHWAEQPGGKEQVFRAKKRLIGKTIFEK